MQEFKIIYKNQTIDIAESDMTDDRLGIDNRESFDIDRIS